MSPRPVERIATRLLRRAARTSGPSHPTSSEPHTQLLTYRGHGSGQAWHLKGRVLRGEPIAPAQATDTRWRNLVNTVRRLESDPVPHARVAARSGAALIEATADDEGFWELCVPAPPAGAAIWHSLEVELLAGGSGRGGEARACAEVLVPPANAEFGIISDIDDTVIRTDVNRLVSMLRIVLFTNAHTRLPFEGVAGFYRALHGGSDGDRRNPIFYVSSSPWNFYDLLDQVLEVHGIPVGPLFLRDYDLHLFRRVGAPRPAGNPHQAHKLATIRHLLETHPRLKWVLLGDSGQRDPEIYREVVRSYPGRVRAVYIRDVTRAARDRQVYEMAAELGAEGVPMMLVGDTVAAATHAAGLGLTAPATVPEVADDKARDEAAPSPVASVLTGK